MIFIQSIRQIITMKKFKVKELRFSNLLVEDINVPKNLIVRIKNIPRSKKALLEEVAKKISEKIWKRC